MNAGIDRVIHAQQQHPAVRLGQCADRSQRLLHALCCQELIGIDPGKGLDRMRRPPGAWMAAQGFREHTHLFIRRHVRRERLGETVQVLIRTIGDAVVGRAD